MTTNINKKYKPRVVVFGSRNAINSKDVKKEVQNLSLFIAEENLVLVNGGSKDGVMGYSATVAHQAGGETYGIGLHHYEPTVHKHLTNYEGYTTHWERQRRLIEMGDIFVAFKGGFGTLHEIVEVYLTQGLAETHAPLILIGDFFEYFNDLVAFFEEHKMGRHTLLDNKVYLVKNADEAKKIIKRHVASLKKSGYIPVDYYPGITPEAIYDHVRINSRPYYVYFAGETIKVLPDVYPSNRFRSSRLLAEYAKKQVKGKKVLDMGCASGALGIVAAKAGAKYVVQVDINPKAINNARENARELGIEQKMDSYVGNGFAPISYKYKNFFDLIIFNPPFHSTVEKSNQTTELMNAFHTEGLEGGILDTFFRDAQHYLSKEGKLLIVFSNKDPVAVEYLEYSMIRYGFKFTLDILEKNTNADVRVYVCTPKQIKKTVVAKKEINLGVLLAKHGNARIDGHHMIQGADLAVSEHLASGAKINVFYADDNSNVKGTIEGVSGLISKNKIDALIGPTWSTLVDQASSYLEEASIPYFIPATSLDIVDAEDKKFVITGSHKNSSKGAVLQSWMAHESMHSYVYLYRDVKWGRVHAEVFSSAVGKNNSTNISFSNKKEEALVELKKFITSTKLKKDAVIVVDNYDDILFEFIKMCSKLNIQNPIVCTLNISNDLLETLKKEKRTMPIYELAMPVPERFVEKYKNLYKQKPTRYAFNSYMAVNLLVDAHKRSPHNIREAVIKNKGLNIYGEVVSFDEEGQIDGESWMIKRIDFLQE